VRIDLFSNSNLKRDIPLYQRLMSILYIAQVVSFLCVIETIIAISEPF